MILFQSDPQAGIYLLAALGFSLLFPAFSFLVNRRLCGNRLDTDPASIVLLSTLVFMAAILCEATVNPVYEAYFGQKLWVYRLLPLHDGNVSVLGLLVWTTYGVHLYFLNQTLDRYLPTGRWRMPLKALVIGCEAPLLWEVMGNLYFLITVGEYYAYYLPGELFHLTSFQVVPVYVGCVFVGLLLYDLVRRIGSQWRLSGLFMAAGLMILAVG